MTGRGLKTINLSRPYSPRSCSGCGAPYTNRRFCRNCSTPEERALAVEDMTTQREAAKVVGVIADDYVPTPRDPLRQVWAFIERAQQIHGVKAVSVGTGTNVYVWTRANKVSEEALTRLAKLCDVDLTIQRLEVEA